MEDVIISSWRVRVVKYVVAAEREDCARDSRTYGFIAAIL
jgi:hypothetical protein